MLPQTHPDEKMRLDTGIMIPILIRIFLLFKLLMYYLWWISSGEL